MKHYETQLSEDVSYVLVTVPSYSFAENVPKLSRAAVPNSNIVKKSLKVKERSPEVKLNMQRKLTKSGESNESVALADPLA